MNKKILALLSVLTVGPLSLLAQTPPTGTPPAAPAPAAPAAPSMAFTVTPSVVSAYMFRGVRLGGAAIEPQVQMDYGNLSLWVWANFPFDNKVPGQSDPEIDPSGSYKFVVSESLNIQPGFTWYTYVRADKKNGFYKGTFEPNLAVNYTVGGLTLTPKLYYDAVLQGPTAELNAAYTVPLKELGTELDFTGTAGTYKWKTAVPDVNPEIKNWGDYWLVGVALPFQITKESKVTLGYAYTEGRNNFFKQGTAGKSANAGAIGKSVVSLSVAISF